jgi:Flp pilus assembly protein TadD
MSAATRRQLAAALLACVALHGCAAATATSPSAGTIPGKAAAVASPAEIPEIPEMTAAGHEQLGDLHTGQGSFDRAYLEYREALRLEPSRDSARYKAARILLRQGLVPEAREEFAAILAEDPGNPLALLGMGHAAVLSGDTGAERILRDALAGDATLWQAHNLLGLTYSRQGAPDKAIAEFKAALALNPTEGSVANNLGVAQLRSGDLEGAVASFRRAIASGCRDPRASNNLGLALARLGRRDEAIEAFRQNGTTAAAWNNLGFTLLLEGQKDAAIEAFQKAVEAEGAYYQRAHDNLQRALGAKDSPPRSLKQAP